MAPARDTAMGSKSDSALMTALIRAGWSRWVRECRAMTGARSPSEIKVLGPGNFGKDLMVPRIIRNVGEGDRSLRVDVLINVGFGGGRSQTGWRRIFRRYRRWRRFSLERLANELMSRIHGPKVSLAPQPVKRMCNSDDFEKKTELDGRSKGG